MKAKTYHRAIAFLVLFVISIVANAQNYLYEETKPAASKTFPYNGMGRVVLQKHFSDNNEKQPILTKEDFVEANTVYVLKYDFRLAEDIAIPNGCVLLLDGGSITGGHILKGTNTSIDAYLVKIIETEVTLAGSWNVREAYPEWFGAKGDGITDDAEAIQKAFELHCPVYLQCKVYGVSKPISLVETTTITSCSSELNANPHAVSYSTPDYTPQRGCIKALSKTAAVLMIDGISVSIRNIAIDGNNKLAECGIGQDRKKYKSRVIIDNCYVYNCKNGISTNLYLSEITNNTCHQCEVGFHNESATSATMTSLTITRNYSKNCTTGYKFVGLIYSNLSNNACDRCTNGVILSRVRCCNFLSNGFEYVSNVYLLSENCDAIEFNGVYGGGLNQGAKVFFTDSTFFGDFTVRNVKMLHIGKIASIIDITGNTEVTRYCVVHVDRTVNKFLCKGKGKYKIVEYEKNLLDEINLLPCSVNYGDVYTLDPNHPEKKHIYDIANGAYYVDSFEMPKGARLIYELAEVTLEPGDYLFGGFVISDQDIQEKVTCVLSKGKFTNDTFVSTRHNSGCFSLDEKTTLHMCIDLNKIKKVPSMIIAPYICKVN